jgi:hypothetical protein
VTAALAAGGGYSATTGASGTFTITAVAGGQITFSSVSHNFGQVAVGTAATAYGLTITNTSTTTAYPFSLVFTPAKGFTVSQQLRQASPQARKCQLDFYFTPTATVRSPHMEPGFGNRLHLLAVERRHADRLGHDFAAASR